MNRILRMVLIFLSLYLCVCLVLFPREGIAAAQAALFLCAGSVVPTLFPYLLVCGFLSKSGFAALFSRYLSPVMKPIFGVPGSGAIALVLGTVSGYPTGAVCAAELYASGECSKTDAERLLGFCNNSGPLFILSVVATGFLQSPHIGGLLYVSHAMSAVLAGIILRTYKSKASARQKALPKALDTSPKSTLRIFGQVMDSSVFSILKICGFVVFFSVLAASLPQTPLTPFVHSLLEITGGTQALAGLEMDFDLKISLISFFVALSGLSVLFQVGAIVSEYGLSLKPYVLGKLLQGVFSAVLTKILVSRLPVTVDVFRGSSPIVPTPLGSFTSAMLMLAIGLLILGLLSAVAKLSLQKK